MKKFKERWGDFFRVVCGPWSTILILGTVLLLIVLLYQTDKTVITILTFIISLSSGILGGILGKRWEDLTEERVIVARGKSAIRDLKLLLGSVVSLESRVRQYQKWHSSNIQKKSCQSYEIIKVHLEEIVERCNTLEEQAINSIENWTDVIPEANISTQIGVITDLKEKVKSLDTDLDTLNLELAETKNKSQEETIKIREEKRKKEKELLEARQELREKAISFSPGITTGSGLLSQDYLSASAISGQLINFSGPRICSKCGKILTDTAGSLLAFSDLNLCPSCRIAVTSLGK